MVGFQAKRSRCCKISFKLLTFTSQMHENSETTWKRNSKISLCGNNARKKTFSKQTWRLHLIKPQNFQKSKQNKPK